ncbi:hypothetical protein GCM10028864_63980 [Microlunatus parietis]
MCGDGRRGAGQVRRTGDSLAGRRESRDGGNDAGAGTAEPTREHLPRDRRGNLDRGTDGEPEPRDRHRNRDRGTDTGTETAGPTPEPRPRDRHENRDRGDQSGNRDGGVAAERDRDRDMGSRDSAKPGAMTTGQRGSRTAGPTRETTGAEASGDGGAAAERDTAGTETDAERDTEAVIRRTRAGSRLGDRDADAGFSARIGRVWCGSDS